MSQKIEHKYRRHWSFVVCDIKYIYPICGILFVIGLWLSVQLQDSTQLNRIGSFIVALGVWLSLRNSFREGINKNKNLQDEKPVLDGGMLNSTYFNKIAWAIGDAKLQIHGFFIVFFGGILTSYGDKILDFIIKVICNLPK